MSDRDTRARPRKVSMSEGAKCPQSCYISIFRDAGTIDEHCLSKPPEGGKHSTARRRVEALQQLGAVHSRTERAEDDQVEGRKVGGHWIDWFRVPITPEQDFNRIKGCLRYNKISHGGPFWDLHRDVGRVAIGSGGDAKTAIRKSVSIQKERVKQVEQQRYPTNLMRDLFGRSKTLTRIDERTGEATEYTTLVMDYGLLSRGHVTPVKADSLPSDWNYGHKLWFKIIDKWPDFERIWTATTKSFNMGDEWAMDALREPWYNAETGSYLSGGVLDTWIRLFDNPVPVYPKTEKPAKYHPPTAIAIGYKAHDNLEAFKVENRISHVEGTVPESVANPNWIGVSANHYPAPKCHVWLMEEQEGGSGI